MFRRPSKTINLRTQLGRALNAGRLNEALDLYELIEKQRPDEPRWSHRRGDLLQRMGRKADAVLAYERAVDLYAAKGFVARAAAMAKLILAIDPSKGEVLERVDPRAARRLHRENRAVIVTADEQPEADPEGPPTDTQSLITDALPLITDRTAPPDETRFTKPEKTEDITLDITNAELVEGPPFPESSVSHRPSAATLAQLPSMPLFAEVPLHILRTLVQESTLVDVEDGGRLTTSGTSAEALYVLIEGNAVGRQGTDVQDLLLGEGDLAGVSCLLSNVRYGADVIACGRVRALRISKVLLDALVRQHPPLATCFWRFSVGGSSQPCCARIQSSRPSTRAREDGSRACSKCGERSPVPNSSRLESARMVCTSRSTAMSSSSRRVAAGSVSWSSAAPSARIRCSPGSHRGSRSKRPATFSYYACQSHDSASF